MPLFRCSFLPYETGLRDTSQTMDLSPNETSTQEVMVVVFIMCMTSLRHCIQLSWWFPVRASRRVYDIPGSGIEWPLIFVDKNDGNENKQLTVCHCAKVC